MLEEVSLFFIINVSFTPRSTIVRGLNLLCSWEESLATFIARAAFVDTYVSALSKSKSKIAHSVVAVALNKIRSQIV